MSDDDAASSAYNLVIFIAAAFWVPLYREFHFYFAHRSLLNSIYSILINCNALDLSTSPPCTSTSTASTTGTPTLSRSPDCACIPSSISTTSAASALHSWFTRHLLPSCTKKEAFKLHIQKQLFRWNGIHLLISPAASHSGWEDHFQSDQYHYLHHRFFECNYGTSREF